MTHSSAIPNLTRIYCRDCGAPVFVQFTMKRRSVYCPICQHKRNLESNRRAYLRRREREREEKNSAL